MVWLEVDYEIWKIVRSAFRSGRAGREDAQPGQSNDYGQLCAAFLYCFYSYFYDCIQCLFYEGQFDTEMFKTVVFSADNIAAMTNTIIIGFAVTIFGTIVGLFYAWLLGRSDIPCKNLMRALFMIPYMFPPFFGAMAWDMLLSAAAAM